MHLLVGVVGRPVGLKGEVEVEVVSDDPSRFEVGSRLIAAERTLTVRSVRRNRNATVVAFAEVVDRDGADTLRGLDLVVPASQARELGPREYWDHDLIGCEVVTTGGERIGTVEDVLHGPATEVLVVGKHLVPLVADIVVGVEPKKTITIDPIPGLLDSCHGSGTDRPSQKDDQSPQ